MLRRSLALAPAALLLACSAPPAPAPRTGGPAPSAAPSASAAAAAPRTLNGTPVVLAGRTPTIQRGAEWAWLMPEGRLVTLAPPDKDGRRGLLGPNFFTGPEGAFVGLEKDGALAIAADGEIHRLGIFEQAAFDAKGQRVLVWNSSEWALFSRKGEKLDGLVHLTVARPILLPSGGLVMHLGSANTTIMPPNSDRPEHVPLRCDEAYAKASRLVCFDDTDANGRDIGPRKPKIVVVSLDTGKEIGRFPIGPLKTARPAVAFRADGQAMALAGETIEVVELPHDGQKASSKTIFRRKSSSIWRMPRMGFAADGKRLCVEEAEGTHVLDTAASEFKNAPQGRKAKDTRPVCLFAPRGEEASGPSAPALPNEWDAVPLSVATREGWEPPARIFSARQRLESEALSFDRKTGVLVELHTEEGGQKRKVDAQAVVIDAATGAVKRVIPFGTIETSWAGPPLPEVSLSDDGAILHVCAARLIAEGCRDYDTATGKSTSPVPWPQVGRSRTEFNIWNGKWPEALAAPVLAALGIPPDAAARVTQWTDEGRYVSIEVNLGGSATVRLNLPDAPERVVRDVAAVAGGAMLGLVVQGAVELWTVQPLELQAVLVALPDGGAAMFADGSVETFGEGDKALGCQQGETIAPVDQCGDVRAAKGTLAALVSKAAAKK
jgi:hypothetical protein